MTLHRAVSGFKPDAPSRTHIESQPAVVAAFADLHNALAERDFAVARRLIREMRVFGYSIVPLDKSKGGTR